MTDTPAPSSQRERERCPRCKLPLPPLGGLDRGDDPDRYCWARAHTNGSLEATYLRACYERKLAASESALRYERDQGEQLRRERDEARAERDGCFDELSTLQETIVDHLGERITDD